MLQYGVLLMVEHSNIYFIVGENLVNILQKNCNEYFAQNIQLEAKVKLLEEQIETLTKENVKLKSKEITRKKKEDK